MADPACTAEWTRIATRTGTFYYYNNFTTLTTWDLPEPDDSMPAGWRIAFDDSGKCYYYHPESGETRWEKPEKPDCPSEIPVDASSPSNESKVLESPARSPKNRRNSVSVAFAYADISDEEDEEEFVNAMCLHPSTVAETRTDPAVPSPKPGGKVVVTGDMERFAEKHMPNAAKDRKGIFALLKIGGNKKRKSRLAWQYSKSVATKPALDHPYANAVPSISEAIYVYCGDKSPSKQFATSYLTSSTAYAPDLVRAIFGLSIAHEDCAKLRTEVYVHLIRHLNGNPSASSIKSAMELLTIALQLFLPEVDMVSALASFLRWPPSELATHSDRIEYCLRRIPFMQSVPLRRMCVPDMQEIDYVRRLPSIQPVFSVTLEEYMVWQRERHPHLAPADLPHVLVALSKSIVDLGGLKTQGIFRLPGHHDTVGQIVSSMQETGNFDMLHGCRDLHVCASVFKLWLRSLAEPLIPVYLYRDCIAAAMDQDKSLRVVARMEPTAQRVLQWVIIFLQQFCVDSVIKATSMSLENLAIVFCPNLLRDPNARPDDVLRNTFAERSFVMHLLKGVQR